MQNKENIQMIITIMNSLIEKVNNNEIISPAEWVGKGLRIEVLTESLDDVIAENDGVMMDEEIRLIEEGTAATKAKILRTKVIDYTEYLKLKALRTRIDEFIKLAKKRATLTDKY